MKRDNSESQSSSLEQSFLSKSQQELLDLIYAFKSGKKTISQVEQQFAEWHTRHMGNCPHSFIRPYNKLPKRSSFGLAAFTKILGIQKKKISSENKFEYYLEKGQVKNSEAATTAQKHLSNTSSSSANSGLSETSKTTSESVKSPEPITDLTPPICPKRPPPVPPKRSLPTDELSKTNQIYQAHTLPALKTETTLQNQVKKVKPIPPPKPKFRLQLNSQGLPLSESSHPTVETRDKNEDSSKDGEVTILINMTGLKRPPRATRKRPLPIHELLKTYQMFQVQTSSGLTTNATLQSGTKKEKPIPPPKPKFGLKLSPSGLTQSEVSHSTVERRNKKEELRQDGEDDSNVRPSSPDYIIPDMHCRSGRPKLQRQPRQMDYNHKLATLPNQQPFSATGLAHSPAARSRKITEPNGPELSSQTLELLKRANLLIPDRTKPKFYVRSNSDPNFRLSERTEVQKKNIYLEILPPTEEDLQNQSTPVNGNNTLC